MGTKPAFYGRAALLLLLAWWALRLGTGSSERCLVDGANLAFHEAGHLFFGFCGSTMHFLGGTLGQLLVPAALGVYFLFWQRQPFASAVCLWWAGESLVDVAGYMADARTLALPLVGGGTHDWNWLFYRFGLLTEPAVNGISSTTHLIGVVLMLIGLAWGAYFILPVATRQRVHAAAAGRWPWLEVALES
jgi:hypothetical protein